MQGSNEIDLEQFLRIEKGGIAASGAGRIRLLDEATANMRAANGMLPAYKTAGDPRKSKELYVLIDEAMAQANRLFENPPPDGDDAEIIDLLARSRYVTRAMRQAIDSSKLEAGRHAQVTDYAQFRVDTKRALIADNLSSDKLLEMTREGIRTVRQNLNTYRKVQEPVRYQMTVEDLEAIEDMHKRLQNDQSGTFTHEDYVDNQVEVMALMNVMTSVMTRFNEAHKGAVAAAHGRSNAKGCIIPLVTATGIGIAISSILTRA